ncbi:MAG: DUF2520 domain-containing protein [Ferruginibacter sp.]|nr:DUF2520 domain-containing protein [Ferruginibacter sp.]
MRITLIGTGNVATVLGRLFTAYNHQIVSVWGRTPERTVRLASEFGAIPGSILQPSKVETDIYIIALTDTALQESVMHFNFGNIPVVHTAGSVSKDVLQTVSSQYGVLYPLQTLKKELPEIPEIPFLVDANSDELLQRLTQLTGSVSSRMYKTDDQGRLKMHVAAVLVNNFTNHLYTMAHAFCEEEHVPFDLLKPLIMETANRVLQANPADIQTGPAIRKDITTLDKHLRILNTHPKLRTMYLRMTDSIMNP